MYEIVTRSSDETYALGKALGRLLVPGDFIALIGDLGSGKTRFTAGIAAGAGVPADVPLTSPTYTFMNEYHARLPLFHFDLYRLENVDDIVELGFEDYFYGNGACVVEWADRIAGQLPDQRLQIRFLYLGENERRIIFTPEGPRYQFLCSEFIVYSAEKMF